MRVCVKEPVLVYKGAGLGRLWDATLGCCRKKWCLILTESLSCWESSELVLTSRSHISLAFSVKQGG